MNEPDEGRYAAISLDLLRHPDHWWEPRMSGFAHYDKPPLIYWIIAASFRLFGVNEWAARVPSLLGGLFTLVGVGWAAARRYNREVAWWSVLICGTFGQVWLLARFLTPDMLLTGWCTLAIAAWTECVFRDGQWRWWLLSMCFWSLAWWTKATAALVPFFGLMAGLLITGEAAGLKALRPARLLASILVLGSPWYLAHISQHRELAQFFFGRELVGRVTGHVDGRGGPIYYYLVISSAAWLPWLPLAAAKAIQQRHETATPFLVGTQWTVEAWIVTTGLLVFSLISSKLPTYTLPLAPWAAVMIARLLLRNDSNRRGEIWQRISLLAAAAFSLILLITAIVAPKFEAGFRLNSSIRPIAKLLSAHAARSVFLDRYWPGMEYYSSQRFWYVTDKEPKELGNDPGLTVGQGLFCRPSDWTSKMAAAEGPVWVVHYQLASSSPFAALEARLRPKEEIQIGDFVLWRFK